MDEKDLKRISAETLAYYEGVAERFWSGTKDHDVSQNYQALLDALPQRMGLDILDFGCGPGRDLVFFKNRGHHAVGLEGSRPFVVMAKQYSGCEVLQQDFLALHLKPESFDGIFANASLFHVPSRELPRVLGELFAALRPGGVLFSSNPRGNEEGWDGQRYGTYMEFDIYEQYLSNAGFVVEQHYFRPPGKAREQQPWLAVVSRKPHQNKSPLGET